MFAGVAPSYAVCNTMLFVGESVKNATRFTQKQQKSGTGINKIYTMYVVGETVKLVGSCRKV